MQIDFHYFATYAAAYLAGYKHEEALDIAYSAFFVDQCTNTFLLKVKGPKIAATTQLQMLIQTLLDYRILPEYGLRSIFFLRIYMPRRKREQRDI